jgi:hypothetical protein
MVCVYCRAEAAQAIGDYDEMRREYEVMTDELRDAPPWAPTAANLSINRKLVVALRYAAVCYTSTLHSVDNISQPHCALLLEHKVLCTLCYSCFTTCWWHHYTCITRTHDSQLVAFVCLRYYCTAL